MARLLPLAAGSFALAALAALAACSTAPEDARIGIYGPPAGDAFAPVGKVLDHRCGSLDCHGFRQRNLIIYGCEGLRLDPADKPGCLRQGGKNTTPDEFAATYRSLVGLEPTVMSSVVAGGGEHPELLTFVRKGRGDEHHKGGQLIVPGDAADRCIASWLASATDADVCAAALDDTVDAGQGGAP